MQPQSNPLASSKPAPSARRHRVGGGRMRAFRLLRNPFPLKLWRINIPFHRLRFPLHKLKVLRNGTGRKRALVRRVTGAAASSLMYMCVMPVAYLLAKINPEGKAAASTVMQRALSNAPCNAVSRWVGKFAQSTRIPLWLHQRMIRMVIRSYGVDTSEIEKPLTEYKTLQEFFSRRLVPGARVPHAKSPLVSPCDAELLQLGRISDTSMLLQVKGDMYHVSDLLCSKTELFPAHDGKHRWYFLFHLRPKDYHRFHSPADIEITEAVHIPGTLHPVTSTSAKWIPGLFAKNERVSVCGTWCHGQFAMVPVGATCVGSISLAFDSRIKTNTTSSMQNCLSLFKFASGATPDQREDTPDEAAARANAATTNVSLDEIYPPRDLVRYEYRTATPEEEEEEGGQHTDQIQAENDGIESSPVRPVLAKGEEMGWFNWGSAIVLIVDVPENVGVMVKPMTDVRVGDPLLSW